MLEAPRATCLLVSDGREPEVASASGVLHDEINVCTSFRDFVQFGETPDLLHAWSPPPLLWRRAYLPPTGLLRAEWHPIATVGYKLLSH